MLTRRSLPISAVAIAAVVSLSIVVWALERDDGAPESEPGGFVTIPTPAKTRLADVPGGCSTGGDIFGASARRWAVCSWSCGGGDCSKRLYESWDGGRTWNALAEHLWGPGTPTPGIGALPSGPPPTVVFMDAERAWLIESGHSPSLHRTSDGGRTWTRVTPGDPGGTRTYIREPKLRVGLSGSLFVLADGEEWQSLDGGNTWTLLSSTPAADRP